MTARSSARLLLRTLEQARSAFLATYWLWAGRHLFFSVFTPVVGFELWKSDGTALGTTMVRDIRSGPGSSSPRAFAALGSELYFVASDGSSGTELWKSDGTPGNTARVKDISPGSGSSVDASGGTRVVAGSTLYFAADDGTSGKELWKTDGSELNTVRVADVYPGTDGELSGGDVRARRLALLPRRVGTRRSRALEERRHPRGNGAGDRSDAGCRLGHRAHVQARLARRDHLPSGRRRERIGSGVVAHRRHRGGYRACRGDCRRAS